MMGHLITETPGYPNHTQFELVDLFTGVLISDKKENFWKALLRLMEYYVQFSMFVQITFNNVFVYVIFISWSMQYLSS